MRGSRTSTLLTASLLALALAATPVLAGCGSKSSSSSSTSSNVHLAKTKFVLHAGLAFGAFHRYIYKPLRSGTLTAGGLFKHKLALVKAGLAGLFVYHELKLALADARASPLLSHLLAPLLALESRVQSLGARLEGGHVDPSSITQANGQIAGVDNQARAAGQPVTDLQTSSLHV